MENLWFFILCQTWAMVLSAGRLVSPQGEGVKKGRWRSELHNQSSTPLYMNVILTYGEWGRVQLCDHKKKKNLAFLCHLAAQRWSLATLYGAQILAFEEFYQNVYCLKYSPQTIIFKFGNISSLNIFTNSFILCC